MNSPRYLLFPAVFVTCGLVASSLSLTATSLRAQPVPAYEEEVVSIARRSQALLDTVGNISLLGEDELQFIDATHIQDTLVRVPGVNFHQGNGQEYLPAIRSAVLTGAGACGAFLTAQDYIPLRAAGFCNINELFEANTEIAERIEVIRGPSNALYGSNAMHGVINVLLPGVPEHHESRVSAEAGPNDYGRVKFYSGINDDHGGGWVISGAGTHDGGFRDAAYYDQQKLQLRHETSVASTRIATSFTASNLNQETAGYVVSGVDAYKDDDAIKTNPNPEAYRDARSFRLYSRIQNDFSGGGTLTVTPYLRKTEMEFLQHFLPGNPLEENGQDSLGLMLDWYDNNGDVVSWVAGLDLEWTEGYLKQSQDVPTQGSAFLQATIPSGKHYDYTVDATQIAPYVNVDINLSQRWKLNAGMRYESMQYDYDNRMLNGRTRDDGTECGFGGCRYSRPADRDDTFDNFSPKLGLLYRINNRQSAYLNIATGFRAPQATELYRLQREQNVADLDSEEVNSIELGVRGGGIGYSYEAAIYTMEKDNVIFRDSDFFNVSDGTTDHFGVELDFSYRFNERWHMSLVANYADHEYADNSMSGGVNINGNKVDSAPETFGSAHLNWLPSENLNLELEWVHVGSYYTDPENLHEYEGHELLNLRAMWNINKQWDLALRVLNLTDKNYAERADFTTFQGDRYFPGEPRSAYLQLTFRN